MYVLVVQSCPTLCDCSLPGSAVRGILQARILEWVAIAFSSDQPDPQLKFVPAQGPDGSSMFGHHQETSAFMTAAK